MRTIKLSKPYINKNTMNMVLNVIESGWLTQGPLVAEFENNFKNYIGSKHALAINSATSGLHIALLSLGVKPGDEIIVPSFTWVATANVVELCGAKPVFADISLDTFNATIESILERISTRTKVVIVVHLFGKPFDTATLKAKLPSNIRIVEDAACAFGAQINNVKCGSVGDMGVYSFHPRKSITTGEGGMVVTNNPELAHTMNMLRNHGQDTRYKSSSPHFMFECPIVGFNYRMTDIQAALGLGQLQEIDGLIKERENLARRYASNLSNYVQQVTLPMQLFNECHSWQSYVILIASLELRNSIMQKLSEYGIETRIGTHAVHTLKYYREKYLFKNLDIPFSYQAMQATISLPLHNHMNMDDIDYVSEKLIEVF